MEQKNHDIVVLLMARQNFLDFAQAKVEVYDDALAELGYRCEAGGVDAINVARHKAEILADYAEGD